MRSAIVLTNAARVALLGAVTVGFVGIAACGDDDKPAPAAAGTTTPPPVGTIADGDASTPSGGDDASPGPLPQPGTTCGKALAKTGFLGSQSIDVDGQGHTYELYIPDTYDGKRSFPVIFVFHGDGGDGAGIRNAYGLEAATQGGAIIVYPDGPDNTWQIDDRASMMKDVGFVDAIADALTGSYCVDASRMFATGFSKGAYFINQLACRSKTAWKGIVSNSGGGPFGTQDDEYGDDGNLKCPHAPIAALQVQGNDDGAVGPDEGMKARDFWKGANGCKDSTASYDPSPCVAYDGCAKPEVWCAVDGLGHQVWDKTSPVAWAFFSKL